MSGRFRDVGLRISRRVLATPQPSRPARRAPVRSLDALDAAAASGRLCQVDGHFWDRVGDYTWRCRRCDALTDTRIVEGDWYDDVD